MSGSRRIGSTLAVVVGLVVAAGGHAHVRAQPHARSVTLAEALAAAGAAPELRGFALRTEAASATADAAGGLPPTSVSVGATSATARLVVAASVPLPIFGTLGAEERVARAGVEVARAEQRTASSDLRLRLAGAWLDLARAQERLALLGADAERAVALVAVARHRVEEGDAPRADAVSATAAAARTTAVAQAGRAVVEASSSALAGLLGWEPSRLLRAAPGLPTVDEPPSLAALLDRARARPSIDLARARSRAAGAEAEQAARACWPELSLEGEAAIADPTLPGTDVRGSLAVALPLFSGRADAQRAAELRHGAALAELVAERRAASADVVTAYRRWEAAAISARARGRRAARHARGRDALAPGLRRGRDGARVGARG